MSSPIEDIDVECPHCGRIYRDWDRASVDPKMAVDVEYMRRVDTGVCPHCGTTVSIGGAGRGSVRRPDDDAIIERGRGPAARMVRIDADTYVPFEHLSDEQTALRSGIRDAVGALAAGPGEVLEASFHGNKPAAPTSTTWCTATMASGEAPGRKQSLSAWITRPPEIGPWCFHVSGLCP